ncbi:MAG TPA: helix-turn-helix domain-containing protein [Ktedonobacteraceae bacterium]|jgi:DNA-binding HxlR family transcriptional regulator|nr:helix-turn-helix domain-containing protein [Ktedonobacteraceae bacterium]
MVEILPFSGTVYDTNCPSRHVLNVIVDKWATLIIGLLGRQTMRFTALHRQIRGISQKMLTQTLRSLERDGLVQRSVYAEVPPRVEYALTPLGRNFYELIAAIREWSNTNVKDIIAAQQQYDTQTLNGK